MATDTLEIFGTEYSGVTGIKATDDNSQTKTYIRPQGTIPISSNGTGIDVSQYASADVAVPTATLQSSRSFTVAASGSQTISPSSGYDAMETVALTVPSGTAGTPSATKGTVSNHSVSVTPSVTNQTGWITGSTKSGTAVTVSASELVSGSETKTANGTYDVTNLASLVVNVSGSTGKAIQVNSDAASVHTNGYTSTGLSLTVAKAGTYNVSWTAWRSSSSGTMGTNLHRNSTTGTNQQTWTNTYGQHITLTNQSYGAGDVLTLYATAGSTSRYCWVSNLIIQEV